MVITSTLHLMYAKYAQLAVLHALISQAVLTAFLDTIITPPLHYARKFVKVFVELA